MPGKLAANGIKKSSSDLSKLISRVFTSVLIVNRLYARVAFSSFDLSSTLYSNLDVSF